MRNNLSSIVNDVKRGIEEIKDDLQQNKVNTEFKYKVLGEPQYDNEILRYNIMVRKLNGEDNIEIFLNEKERLKKNEQKGQVQNLSDDGTKGNLRCF